MDVVDGVPCGYKDTNPTMGTHVQGGLDVLKMGPQLSQPVKTSWWLGINGCDGAMSKLLKLCGKMRLEACEVEEEEEEEEEEEDTR